MLTAPPTIPKPFMPYDNLRKQGSTGLFFEYTLFHARKLGVAHVQVHVANLAMFAAGANLLSKRSTGVITVDTDTPRLSVESGQSTFRAYKPTMDAEGTEMTAELAFLTILHSWEYAALRPRIAATKVASLSGAETVVTGAHTVLSEPLAYPISSADSEILSEPNDSIARKVARNAEGMWLELNTAPSWEHRPTHGHRIPSQGKDIPIGESKLMASLVGTLVEAADDTDELPHFNTSSPGRIAVNYLPHILRNTAQNNLSWS